MSLTPLTIILFVSAVDLIGFGLIIPLQAVYAERLGASALVFGLLIGVYSLMQLLFNPLLGRWSDRVGRRRVLLISIGGSVISHILLGVADVEASLTLLFLARILDGITGANTATAQAYIADVTPPEHRARGMGLFGAAFGLGFVLGPAIGSVLAYGGRAVSGARYGTSWPAFGAAMISATAFVLVYRFLPESHVGLAGSETSSSTTWWSVARAWASMGRVRSLLAMLFGIQFSFVFLEATFVYLCAQYLMTDEVGTGLIFTYVGVLMVIVQGGLVGRMVRRFGEPTLVSVGPFLTAGGFVMISLVPGLIPPAVAWTVLLGACIPIALGNGCTGPSLHALISRGSSVDEQGGVLGLAQGVVALARAISPPIAGAIYTWIGPAWPYRGGALMYVGLGCFALSLRPTLHRRLLGEQA